jgi:hypothetical protein
MGEAIAGQHPAVVLRSQFDHLRALLAVALIAVAGLTAAVAILAPSDNDELAAGIRGPLPAGLPTTSVDESIRGPLPAGLPTTSVDQSIRGPLPAGLPTTSVDESIRGPLPAGLPTTSVDEGTRSATEAKDEAATAAAIGQANSSSATEMKDEAATAAAIGQE